MNKKLSAKLNRPATYDDILKLPENMIGEIVDGELYTSPRPSAKHAIATTKLITKIDGSFGSKEGGGPGGWWIVVEPELHLQSQVLVPDLAGWRKERLPTIPDAPHFDLVPDWICEVLSPSNIQLDRIKKVPKYSALGVNHLWLVDPMARTLEVFRRETIHWLLLGSYAEDQKFNADPFALVEFDLSALWGE
jgi:Uma2 family endonuclease